VAKRVVVRAENEAAGRNRPDVVAMSAAAGHRFAGQRERIQRFPRQRFGQQCVRRDQGRDAGCRRSAHARAQRDALVEFDLEAVAEAERAPQFHDRHAGGIAVRLHRQVDRRAADRADAHHGFVDAAHRGAIARSRETVAEDVETDRHVADTGRRERDDAFLTHTRAPKDDATRSRSANTPAAVTSGPAPGPCTTRGLVE